MRSPLMIAGWLLLAANALAQTATQVPAPPTTPQVASVSGPQAILDGTATASSGSSAEPATDPVSRFLSDRGLIDTRPVAALAQQVKDKATDLASDLVISAMDFLGVRYQRGGQSQESGFDCSGFTRHVFERSVGLLLPRRASEQAAMPGLTQINQAELKPGDLVFFNTLRHTFSHVGIYIGDNKFIHSPRAGGSVRVEDMRLTYWQQRFDGARRVPALSTKLPTVAANRADTAP